MYVVVSVSDKYLWSLQPFALLFNKYWSPDIQVFVAGYTPPTFRLPDNFAFYSIDMPGYPKEKWVDGFLSFLDNFGEDHFVLMLEDYWLNRMADVDGVSRLFDYARMHSNILRIDLTADRLYAGGMRDVDRYDRFDIIEAPNSQYQMSLQAGIWNTRLFSDVLHTLPDDRRSAWDVELEGTGVVNSRPDVFRVVGTRQNPVRYTNGMNNAVSHKVNFDMLSPVDIRLIYDMIPADYKEGL